MFSASAEWYFSTHASHGAHRTTAGAPMLVDLHAHYPMHVLPQPRQGTHAQIERWQRARLRAEIVRLLSRFANYQAQGDQPGVTLEYMRKGHVRVIFSALYCPFDEMDLGKRYAAPPVSGYFDDLLEQL